MEVRDEVMGHLVQMFDEIEADVKCFPADLWRREDEDELLSVPAFLAHHTIWCMHLPHLLAIPEDKLPPNPADRHYRRDKLPSQQQLLDYLDGIREYCSAYYGQMSNDDYLSQGDSFAEPLGMVIYTIAHTRHHLGQLVQILKDNGITPSKWYPR